MGRPLNKKYFGNFNIGTNGYTPVPGGNIGGDDGIGGEGVASVVLNALGSYTTRPVFTFSAPEIPGGVTATGTITSEVVTATNSNGTTGTAYVVGDLVTFAGITGVIGYVTVVGAGVGEIQGIEFTQAGTSRGSFTTLPAGVTNVAVVGGSGTLGTVNIAFRANAVVVTEKGSGYTAPPTATPTQSVTFTSVALTTDVGTKTAGTNLNVATNQNNAIIIHANVGGEGGTLIGDIREQVGSRRYRVKTADDVKVCKLVADDTPGTKQAYIKATDDNGNTYFVIKLTAHRATLIQWSNNESTWLYADNAVAGWTFGSAVAPGDAVHSLGLVTIENA
jgi:hypothetical protein